MASFEEEVRQLCAREIADGGDLDKPTAILAVLQGKPSPQMEVIAAMAKPQKRTRKGNGAMGVFSDLRRCFEDGGAYSPAQIYNHAMEQGFIIPFQGDREKAESNILLCLRKSARVYQQLPDGRWRLRSMIRIVKDAANQ